MVLLTANIMDTVGDHDGAETLYRRLVRRTSGNIAALIDLGDALRRKGRAASARIFYKRALKSLRERRQTGELFVEAVGGMASVEMNLGKHERALKVIAEGLHECPWSGELLGTFGAYQQEYLRKGGGGARQAEGRGRKRDV
jgi:tetratricopeptide (TPR) repeat protein